MIVLKEAGCYNSYITPKEINIDERPKKIMNEWWRNAVIYQIYPRSFKDSNGDGFGDLKGIIEKLDYIKRLGADAIWICPVYDSPQHDNGYDIRNYYQIYEKFGTMEDAKELIKKAHERGIRVIMDLVANHTSDEHPWFKESCKGKDNPYSDFYIWKEPKKDGTEPNNWGSKFSGSAWEYNENRGEYYLHYYAVQQPDLNWENEKVRRGIYDTIKYWNDLGVDGWRLDAIAGLSKYQDFADYPAEKGKKYIVGDKHVNGPRLHEFLQEMNREALAPYNSMTVGEAPGATPEIARLYTDPDRHELNMLIMFSHMTLDFDSAAPNRKWATKSFPLSALKTALADAQEQLEGHGWNALFFENHDQPRVISRWGNDTNYRVECAKAYATVLHGLKGTPYIYQGEEIGMTNIKLPLEKYQDVEILNGYHELVEKAGSISREDFMEAVWNRGRDNGRTPVQWDDSKNAGFTSGTPWFSINENYKEINAAAALKDPDSIFYYYQKLIRLRHEHDILMRGSFSLLMKEHPELFVYERMYQKERWLVVANLSDKTCSVKEIEEQLNGKNGRFMISNLKRTDILKDIQPYEAFIYATDL